MSISSVTTKFRLRPFRFSSTKLKLYNTGKYSIHIVHLSTRKLFLARFFSYLKRLATISDRNLYMTPPLVQFLDQFLNCSQLTEI